MKEIRSDKKRRCHVIDQGTHFKLQTKVKRDINVHSYIFLDSDETEATIRNLELHQPHDNTTHHQNKLA